MKSLSVLVLFDFPFAPPKDRLYKKALAEGDYQLQESALAALDRLGHKAWPFAIYGQIAPLVTEIRHKKPDVVLNLCDTFVNDRRHEPHVAGVLELLGCAYTGCPPEALSICRNKSWAKRVLEPLDVPVPHALTFSVGGRTKSAQGLKYPVIVKPLGLEGSDGISQSSFCANEAEAMERVKFLHESLKTDAYVEEFIEGRELYASVLGNERLQVLPTREIVFNKFPDDRPKIATFKAKWDKGFRDKWGIKNVFPNLDDKIEEKLAALARTVYKALGLKGCGRLDLRLAEDGELYLLEVNPNPNLATDDEVALSARKAGMAYEDLIDRLLQLALQRDRP